MNICQNIIDDIIPHIVIHLDYFTMLNYLASCKQLYNTSSNDILYAVHQVVEKLAYNDMRQIILNYGYFSNAKGQYKIDITGPMGLEYKLFLDLISTDIALSEDFHSIYKQKLAQMENIINGYIEDKNYGSQHKINCSVMPQSDLINSIKLTITIDDIPCDRGEGYDNILEKFNQTSSTIMGMSGTFDIYQHTMEFDSYSCKWIIDSGEHLIPYNFIGMNNLASNNTAKHYRNYLHLHRLNLLANKLTDLVGQFHG